MTLHDHGCAISVWSRDGGISGMSPHCTCGADELARELLALSAPAALPSLAVHWDPQERMTGDPSLWQRLRRRCA